MATDGRLAGVLLRCLKDRSSQEFADYHVAWLLGPLLGPEQDRISNNIPMLANR